MRKSKKVSKKKPLGKVTRRKKRNLLPVRIPIVKRAKFKVGERVYSVQNPTVKLQIAEVKAQLKGGVVTTKYRILHGIRSGKPILGSWITESSIYTVKEKRTK